MRNVSNTLSNILSSLYYWLKLIENHPGLTYLMSFIHGFVVFNKLRTIVYEECVRECVASIQEKRKKRMCC